jgi:predicted RNase H-like HicB family nuclease
VLHRRLTIQYRMASEMLEQPRAKGWFAYCPELGLRVRGKTLEEAHEKVRARIDRMVARAQRDLDRVIEKHRRLGWEPIKWVFLY